MAEERSAQAPGGSTGPESGPTGPPGGPSEEEIRAAYEQQIKQIRVDQILLENVVTLLNLGMRRTGLAPGSEDERDPEQVRLAVEAVRAILPLLEQTAPEHMRQIRDALSQLQMAYVKIGGPPTPGPGGSEPPPPASDVPAPPGAETPKGGEAGPAQRSGRLWVPGQ
jgi:hypothetical protein